jgi:putative oxidoreductase
MDVIALIGRILLVLVFLGSGTTGHLGQRKGMAQYASSAGIPAAEPLVVVSGVMIIIGGLMVALGVWGDLGALLLLLVFVLATAFLIHAFGSLRIPTSAWTSRSTS